MGTNKTYYRRKELGVCIGCGGERDNHALRCKSCTEKAKERGWNNQYYRRKQQGFCAQCGKPATKDTTRCDECRAKHSKETRKAYYLQKESGITPTTIEHGSKLRQHALKMYGGRCQDCGAANRLELHHLNNNGREERATSAGTHTATHRIYYRLKREGYDPTIALLCRKCHAARHRTIT